MGRLDGKTAIITGAARGQGAAEARLFVSEGAQVLLADVRDDAGEALAAELGPSALYTHLDVTEEGRWAAAVSVALERFGQLNVLVNNAGILQQGTIEGGSLDDYHRTVAVNQTGVWLGIRAAAPALRAAGGGSIVNISSTAGFVGAPGIAAYGATKWAVRGMTKTAALELAGDGIRVNSVHPGFVATDMLLDAGMPDKGVERGSMMTPIGRSATPDDIALVVLFLASDDSAYCSGSEFVVDGALLAGPVHAGGGVAVAGHAPPRGSVRSAASETKAAPG